MVRNESELSQIREYIQHNPAMGNGSSVQARPGRSWISFSK
ncbi:MAG: hypothetical protein R3F37_23890 [Candidatus Competibacteraceae bacterium]